MEAVRISLCSNIYVQNAVGVYVRNLIEKIPQPFVSGETYSQAMETHGAKEPTVRAGSRAKSPDCYILESFVS